MTLTQSNPRQPSKAPPASSDESARAPVANEPLAYFVFENVSWEFYTQTLQELDRSGQHARVTYDRGRMEVMTVGRRHEMIKKAIGRLLETYAAETRIRIEGVGNVTCRREGLRRGLEPDECYYVTSVYRGPDGELDLDRNPPPDLAIEVEVSRDLGARESIYLDLGVPELWRFDGVAVVVNELVGAAYRQVERSRLFPHLDIAEFSGFVVRAIADQGATVLEYADLLRSRKGQTPQ